MTKKELINILAQYPDDMKVCVFDATLNDVYDIEDVYYSKRDNAIMIDAF